MFLRLLGIASSSADIQLVPLRAETAPQVVMPDYVAALTISGQETRTLHVEFFLQYRKEIPSTMARYGGSLAWQYQRPVQSVLLMLRSDGVPGNIPASGEYAIGETRTTHPFRTVRLPELDPDPVLGCGDPGLLPWALLLRLGKEEAQRLGEQIGSTGNEQWIARFLTLGSLRYDREELNQMLGGPRMGLVEAIMEGSSLVRHEREVAEAKGLEKGIEKGIEKGLAKGIERGRAEGEAHGMMKGQSEEARRLLRMALAERFPGLDTMPELDRIHDLSALESLLLKHAMRGTDLSSVRQAIIAAVPRD